MSNYKLLYFDARGFGEPARQLFHLAGVPFEDVRISFDELMPGKRSAYWLELKKKIPFGRLPVLYADGFEVAQSSAICRYLAKKKLDSLEKLQKIKPGSMRLWINIRTTRSRSAFSSMHRGKEIQKRAPIVVHCSAGIGRTGVMIEYIMDQFLSGQQIEESDKILQKIRDQRNNSIQTDQQYLFVHQVIMNYFMDKKLFDTDVKMAHIAFTEKYLKSVH